MQPFTHCAVILSLLLLPLFSGTNLAGEPLNVFVSVLPAEYFTDCFGSERIMVDFLVQHDHCSATYAPTPKQMTSQVILSFPEPVR